jgi:hypothetical protein
MYSSKMSREVKKIREEQENCRNECLEAAMLTRGAVYGELMRKHLKTSSPRGPCYFTAAIYVHEEYCSYVWQQNPAQAAHILAEAVVSVNCLTEYKGRYEAERVAAFNQISQDLESYLSSFDPNDEGMICEKLRVATEAFNEIQDILEPYWKPWHGGREAGESEQRVN